MRLRRVVSVSNHGISIRRSCKLAFWRPNDCQQAYPPVFRSFKTELCFQHCQLCSPDAWTT